MLLLAEGLFRFDVVISGDTLRTLVRNLSTGELAIDAPAGAEVGDNVAFGEAAAYQPGTGGVDFALGSGDDRVKVRIRVATLHLAERGTVRVTAQAVVREAPDSESRAAARRKRPSG